MNQAEITSLREWLAHWGDGPHWADPSGATVPIAKGTLAELLSEVERLRVALELMVNRAETLDRSASVLGPVGRRSGLGLAVDAAHVALERESHD
jgi:hypothetical protein